MRMLFVLFFMMNNIFANDFEWTQRELTLLKDKYQEYISKAPSLNNNDLLALECEFTMSMLVSSNVIDNKGKAYPIPHMEFFSKVDPIDSSMKALSIDQKISIAKSDLSKLEVFLFLLPKQMVLNSRSPKTKHYATFLFEVETELLNWAERAAIAPQEEREHLDRKYRVLTGELAKIDFPQEMGFYRRKMILSIISPDAANAEISRLKESLSQIESQK